MSSRTIPDPKMDYAQPELQQLLDEGIEPLKRWLRDHVASYSEANRFHVTGPYDDNVLSCYLSAFLPRLPPTHEYVQDVVVIHLPRYWQNDCYNRIYTQISGNCSMPDVFHQFLLGLTRAFGGRRVSAHELLFWLDHGKSPEEIKQEEALLHDEHVLHEIAQVEAELGGTIDRSTFHVLVEFGTRAWVGMLVASHHDHEVRTAVYVKGNLVLPFDHFQAEEMKVWLEEMGVRGYIYPWK